MDPTEAHKFLNGTTRSRTAAKPVGRTLLGLVALLIASRLMQNPSVARLSKQEHEPGIEESSMITNEPRRSWMRGAGLLIGGAAVFSAPGALMADVKKKSTDEDDEVSPRKT